MPTFEVTNSETFLIEMFRRYRHSRRSSRYIAILKVFLALCLVAVFAVFILSTILFRAPVAIILIPMIFLWLLRYSHLIDEWLIIRRFRKSPFYNEHYQAVLSPDGFTATGNLSTVQYNWAVFTEAHRMEDGFLLLQGPRVFSWLPMSALVAGTPDEVDKLIRNNIANYKCP